MVLTMSADGDGFTVEGIFSMQFQDECHRELMGFLQGNADKHDGLSYGRLFQYDVLLQAIMLDIYLQSDESSE